ncbi:MAG: hypothetical protein IT256_06825 [Chitinophagaceae bacterium]|nr:hypothetical protein [Chitinophagaceae bacterium]
METTLQLTEAQLAELKKFITKRGMREPDVVNEILDHFACKIEELMSKEPNLPFEEAKDLAHKSFGSTGFRPITKAYEEGLDKIVCATYKRSLKSVLLSPQILFFLLFAILSVYVLKMIPENFQKHWLFGIQFWIAMIPALAFLGASTFYNYNTKRKLFRQWRQKEKLNLWEMKSMGVQTHVFMIIGTQFFIGDFSDKPVPFAFYIFATAICFLSFINAMAQYKTMMKMKEQFGGSTEIA